MIDKLRVLGMLGLAAKAGKITFGADSCKEAIMKNKVKLIILAQDASERTKTKFIDMANKNDIPIYTISDMDEISKAIGKKNKAIVGIVDLNFSKAIEKIINGGGGF